jgi:hypothetical protein
MSAFTLPDYHRIKRVQSFDELVHTRFTEGVNALCWQRTLAGDFAEVVNQLGRCDEGGLTVIDDARLLSLAVSPTGRMAIDAMLSDLQLLREQQRDPVLNRIDAYPHDDAAAAVRTDVYSFHADSAPVEADTFLCTYHGAPSEGLRNEDAVRRIDDPVTRAELLKVFGGADDDAFQEFLRDNCYDLHYASLAGATPYSFGLYNFWRITVDYPGNPVPPCVHRAPASGLEDPPRLLLIS